MLSKEQVEGFCAEAVGCSNDAVIAICETALELMRERDELRDRLRDAAYERGRRDVRVQVRDAMLIANGRWDEWGMRAMDVCEALEAIVSGDDGKAGGNG